MTRSAKSPDQAISEVRERILDTASSLFYRLGVRAVGVDLVVEQAGVAKTSLYRYFRTKDDLVAAFLEREDRVFWEKWEAVAKRFAGDPAGELHAQLAWIGTRAGVSSFRGCAQLNVAAEFPELDHPARRVATSHKRELRSRLHRISEELNATSPDLLAGQLAVLINGALVSSQIFEKGESVSLLQHAATALIQANTERF
ncbi:TetR/AcrR family transcriptional regulator [Caballeronia insecticola]|uniref:Putative transcriptional regulator TetR family n=1 Tax=Caballeronia insecticola TaxID=758793 RepID=A0A060PKU9_9BURK|nr:TetR/AcrR family transcriptional regulator [Caballeronia insecticola]BAO94196.1 putative transcriptional regulator TetR family [Caballeronia insecticola]